MPKDPKYDPKLQARTERLVYEAREIGVVGDLTTHPGDCECRGCQLAHDLAELRADFQLAKKEQEAGLPPFAEMPPPYDPPPLLRSIARRMPHLAWLCELPPEERAFYVQGPNAEHHRQRLGAVKWVWEALGG